MSAHVLKFPTPRKRYENAVVALVAAAVEYDDQVSGRGPDPLLAGARLRLAAKACARAAREAGVLP